VRLGVNVGKEASKMATTTGTKTRKTSTKRKATSAGRRRGTPTGASKAPEAEAAAVSGVDASADAQADAPVTDPVPDLTLAPHPEPAMADPAPDASSDASSDDRLRRTDLIGAIAARVSLKRSDAKLVFDVVLDEIGKALDVSDEVIVPPLGKLMVKKRDLKPGGPMLTLKLKRADAAPTAGDVPPLAEPNEDS